VSGFNFFGFYIKCQFSWVGCLGPKVLGLGFLNIIICIINIIIFIIIESINKIIKKFEKNYYQYWKTTIYFKFKIIISINKF